MTGRLHSAETLGALDGPGIRTVLFLSGCPMACEYCHNPDTLDPAGGEQKTAEELVAFCLRYREYYGANGGVTLSGGEPLLQAEFCLEIMRGLKREGLHVCLDTAGSVYAPEVLRLADLVLLDIKHAQPDRFFALTRYPMDNTLKTLEFLKQSKLPFIVRQVIYPGFTDGDGQMRQLKALSEGAQKIELLPFHNMAAHKWKSLGLCYRAANVLPPDSATMERLNAIAANKELR